MSYTVFKTIAAAGLLTFCAPQLSWAQSTPPADTAPAPIVVDDPSSSPANAPLTDGQGDSTPGMHEIVIEEEQKASVMERYPLLDIAGLFNMYWRWGIARYDREDTITEYIQTTACDVFKNKFKDDFAWPNILRTTTAYIQKYAPTFPNRFTIVQPIALGRYIPDKGHFIITDKTQYKNVTTMFFADFSHMQPPCAKAYVDLPRTIPLMAAIRLSEPFALTEIKMTPDKARAAIDFIDSRLKRTMIENEKQDRFAYVRFYYTINGFEKVDTDGKLNSLFSGPAAVFTGSLDGFSIYADLEGTYPLFEKTPTPPAQ